jgi:hypothetical protein
MTLRSRVTIFIPRKNAKEPDMTSQPQHLSLSLQDQAVFTLPDAHDVDIECRSGTLWITLDHDLRDIVLAPGQHFRSAAHRRALVAAMEPSCVHFTGHDLALAPVERERSPSPWRLGAHGLSPA